MPGIAPGHHRALGQLGGKYLLVEGPEGLLLVDPHALHERWNFERLKDRERPLLSQRLLLPAVVELSPAEAALLDEALPALTELGFVVEQFGPAAVAVSAAPEIVPGPRVGEMVREAFHDLEHPGRGLGGLRERLLASVACRSAVLLGTPLPPGQAEWLLDRLFTARMPATCPHGRPLAFTVTWDEIARRFGRTPR